MNDWLDEMMKSPNIVNPPSAIIGTDHETTSFLNLNDAIFSKEETSGNDQVYWKVNFSEQGSYDFIVHFQQNINVSCQAQLKIGKAEYTYVFEHQNADFLEIKNVKISAGEADLIPLVFLKKSTGNQYIMPFYVEVKKQI